MRGITHHCHGQQCATRSHSRGPGRTGILSRHTLPLTQRTRSCALPSLSELLATVRGQQRQEQHLLKAAQGTDYGACAREPEQAQVLSLAAALRQRPTSVQQLSGMWKLVYTTEESVHKLVRSFGATDITQEIDISAARVTNQICFGPSIALQATAPMEVQSSCRITYKFDALYVLLWGLKLRLPFVRGGGFTEASHCSRTVRVMQNSQGDTLVFLAASVTAPDT